MTDIIRWWEEKNDPTASDIALDPSEHYYLAAHTKKVNGSWEIAIVKWQYRTPYLLALIRDGKKISGEVGWE